MSQLPAHLQRYQSRGLSKALSQNLGAASPPHVSIAGGRFTLIDAAGNEMRAGGFDQKIGVYLDACIIDANDHKSRIYYEQPYDPSAQSFAPPDCWSDNGVGPSVNCSNPQARSCTPDPDGVYGCKWSVWGSAISRASGKGIPKCQEVQKLALLVPEYPQIVFLLRVPPASHPLLRAYNEKSVRFQTDISFVITRIYFEPNQVGVLNFYSTEFINDLVAEAREQAYTENKTDTIVGRTDVARPALAAPAQTQQIAPPVQPQFPSPEATAARQGMGLAPAPAADFQPQAQPGPFANPAPAAAPQIMTPTTPQGTPMSQNPSGMLTTPNTAGPAGTAPTASPSEAAAPQRRRRRVASEAPGAEQAAPAAAPQGSAGFPGGAAPQAPFPHGGQQTAAALPNVTFGMTGSAPEAEENAEVASALNNFFGN